MTKEFKFSPGDKVEEQITNFKGIITGVAFYITGCTQYLVVPRSKDGNTEVEGAWYDEARLVLLEKNAFGTKMLGSKPEIKEEIGPDKCW